MYRQCTHQKFLFMMYTEKLVIYIQRRALPSSKREGGVRRCHVHNILINNIFIKKK